MMLLPDEIMYLKMYDPATYGMNLPREISRSLEAKGMVEWLPPNQWSSALWGLTEAGKRAIKGL